ncbi:MAG: acyl-CoA thioesterase [Acidobacteria bacterium]|mgnify:CR=1 FL=1|nr:MAG: acyl-CoA thioesterase [Acidobacteriota bacterium]REK02143.1 MAG: acyl-CoA thioesterase [Acidobacteriota bacterium]REK14055.1 MAG: acyl-CoA thioesterase [Acidobacteriota bacterium]REK42050.1 MAG: acyl-CoA thioesterase [Acidobacteriota bacterium]
MNSFSHTFTVKASDLDEQGHVNNVTYLQWVQEVAVAHWLEVSSKEIRDKYTWVVTRHEIDYKRQAFEGDEIKARTWVGSRTKVTWDRHTQIRRGEQLLTEARTVWCLIDRLNRRPTRISSAIEGLLS